MTENRINEPEDKSVGFTQPEKQREHSVTLNKQCLTDMWDNTRISIISVTVSKGEEVGVDLKENMRK